MFLRLDKIQCENNVMEEACMVKKLQQFLSLPSAKEKLDTVVYSLMSSDESVWVCQFPEEYSLSNA